MQGPCLGQCLLAFTWPANTMLSGQPEGDADSPRNPHCTVHITSRHPPRSAALLTETPTEAEFTQ